MAEPSPGLASRVAVMRDMAEDAAARCESVVYVRIPGPFGPLERGDRCEGLLAAVLAEIGLGDVSGVGQQPGEGGSIVYRRGEVILTDRTRGQAFPKQAPRRLGVAAGTVIEELTPEFLEHPLEPGDVA